MNINGRKIGYDQPPYIIAEMSCNHAGEFSNAIAIIKAAKDAGCDAIKLQAYDADSLTLDASLSVDGGLWQGLNLYELYRKTWTPWGWLAPLFEYAKAQGITCFSSVYCMDGLRMLEELECPAYKIASFEANHLELLEAVARTQKPVIVSLGAIDDGEVLEAVRILSTYGCGEYALLHCVSQYPTPHDKANLGRIGFLKRWASGKALIGYSDHAGSNKGIAGLAVAAGACILERHMRYAGAPSEDGEFSDDTWYMKSYCHQANQAWKAMQPAKVGDDAPRFKRSIRCIKPVAKGEALTRENVAVLRPSGGLPPRMLGQVLESIASAPIEYGEALTIDNVDIIGG